MHIYSDSDQRLYFKTKDTYIWNKQKAPHFQKTCMVWFRQNPRKCFSFICLACNIIFLFLKSAVVYVLISIIFVNTVTANILPNIRHIYQPLIIPFAAFVSIFSRVIKVITTTTGLHTSSIFHKIALCAVYTGIYSTTLKQRENTLCYWLVTLIVKQTQPVTVAKSNNFKDYVLPGLLSNSNIKKNVRGQNKQHYMISVYLFLKEMAVASSKAHIKSMSHNFIPERNWRALLDIRMSPTKRKEK